LNAQPKASPRFPRIVVVGLLDRQFALVRNEYPSLDLIHYKDGSHGKLDGFIKNADRILVITKFISHSIWDHVDRAKVAYFSGLESLRMSLRNIAAETVFAAPNVVVSMRTEFDPSKPLCDYTPLATSKTGDVLTFFRPPGVPAHVFSQNVEAALTHYRKLCLVQATTEIHGGKADVFISHGAAFPKLAEAEAKLGDPQEVTFRLPTFDEQTRQFWKDVFLSSMRAQPGASPSHYAENANAAVKSWREISGEPEA
jgi:hypothetical protein